MNYVTDSRPRVLHIGPSTVDSQGGIAAVISDFAGSSVIDEHFRQDAYASYMDGSAPRRAIFSAKQLGAFIRASRDYDICHIHMAANASVRRKLAYARIARKSGAKVVVEIHAGRFFDFFNTLKPRAQQRIIRQLGQADALVALSPYWQRQYTELLGLDGFQVVPNAVDTDVYAQCYREVQNPTTVLALGHLREKKGTYDLIEAVAQICNRFPKLKVVLAGGEEVDKARTIIDNRRLTGTIDAVGWVGLDTKRDLLTKADIVTLPSHFEAFPVSLIEGMAAGKAILATRVGGIPDLVDAEGGLLVPPQSPEQLGQALAMLLSEPDTVRRMQSHNMDKAARLYSQEAVHSKLVGLYTSLLTGDRDDI